jgi:5-methyltetrahydrofolate--homocysteine methyltransferase
VIDSTEPAVIKAGMELIGGRPVVNSVNFEDGEGPGSRFDTIMPLVREHGAAVIASPSMKRVRPELRQTRSESQAA